MYICLRLGDVLISPTPTVKYLGLTIDEHLSFSSYVTEVEKKVGTKLAMFRKIRDNLTPAARKTFCSFIQAHLEYGSNAFVHCLHSTQHDRLTRIANRAVRIVFGFPWHYDVSVLHTRYGLAPIALRYQLKLYILVFRAIRGMCSTLLSDCFCLRSATTRTAARTRSQSIDSLALPKARTRYGLFALSFLASDRWNSLPAGILFQLTFALAPRFHYSANLYVTT